VIEGEVAHVDAFGDLVTNIPADWLAGGVEAVELCGHSIGGLSETYGAGDGLAALIGSHGYLEVALPDGNAALQLGAERGEPVRVVLVPK
jgi:S-adenosylmethionine hydrolase